MIKNDVAERQAAVTAYDHGADTGTNNWIPALDDHSGCRPGGICESTMIQRITGNILRLFGQGPAARHQPSVPNWRQVTAQ